MSIRTPSRKTSGEASISDSRSSQSFISGHHLPPDRFEINEINGMSNAMIVKPTNVTMTM